MTAKNPLPLIAVFIFTSIALIHAGETDSTSELAKQIVAELRSKKGIAFDIGCGDGTLALEIARQTDLTVHCVDSDETNTTAVKQRVYDAGFYGTRVIVEKRLFNDLDCPEICANLIFCGDQFVKGINGRDFKEIYRVLSPNGIAFIGQSTHAATRGTKLSREQLEGWLNEAGISTFEIIEKGGVFAKVTRPPLPGSDEWTHRAHDPGNTLGSNDTAIVPPFKLQWANRATPGLGASIILSAGGKQFVLSHNHEELPDDTFPAIHVYDAYNGTLLWERVGKDELPLDRSLAHYTPIHLSSEGVVAGDSLYLLGGKTCHRFDVSDGEIKGVFEFPEGVETGERDIWLYVAHADGVILGGIGEAPKSKKSKKKAIPRKLGTNYAHMMLLGECHTLFGLDPKTGSVKWKHAANAFTNSLTVGGGRIYFVDRNKRMLHGLNLQTGNVDWTTQKEVFPAETIPKRSIYFKDKVWLSATGDGWEDVFRAQSVGKCVPVYAAADGAYLFDAEFPVVEKAFDEKGKSLKFQKVFSWLTFAGDFALSKMGHHSAPKFMVDGETGKKRWEKKIQEGGCGPMVATPEYIFGKYEAVGLNKKISKNDAKFGNLRAACHTMGIPAQGLLHIPASGCACSKGFRGNVTFKTRKGPKPSLSTEPNPIIKGPAYGQPASDSESSTWNCWRGDAARSGITNETVAPPFQENWNVNLPGLLTPLVAGNGVVVAGCMDHLVYGIDSGTGKIKWRYFAEGSVSGAPWLWKGKVYFGDENGWVHCLRIADGEGVWKFNAVPADARIIGDGRLASRWPVSSGVLVQDGVAYFTAGYFPGDTTQIYGLDADTGEVKKKLQTRFASNGMLAFGNGKLYASNKWDFPFSVDMNPEDPAKQIKAIGMRSKHGAVGQHIMVVGENLMVRSPDFVFAPRGSKFRDRRMTLPIFKDNTVYLRNGAFLNAENNEMVELKPAYGQAKFYTKNSKRKKTYYSYEKKDWLKGSSKFARNFYIDVFYQPSIWNPENIPSKESFQWASWGDSRMTAIILAGDILFSGGNGKVFATAAGDGKELWSAPVPGEVFDIGVQNGKLLVVCKNPNTVVCFSSK